MADRGLLVYFIWKTGTMTNRKIGEFFDLSYSSISHIVKSVRSVLEKNKNSWVNQVNYIHYSM